MAQGEAGTDGYGWFWAKLFKPEDWLQGPDTLQRLLEYAHNGGDGDGGKRAV